jgi:hypothetical protein
VQELDPVYRLLRNQAKFPEDTTVDRIHRYQNALTSLQPDVCAVKVSNNFTRSCFASVKPGERRPGEEDENCRKKWDLTNTRQSGRSPRLQPWFSTLHVLNNRFQALGVRAGRPSTKVDCTFTG